MRQHRSLRVLVVALVVPLAIAVALPAGGADAGTSSLSSRDVRRLQKEASEAVSGGRLTAAAGLYEELLAGLPAGDPRRAPALYYGAITYLLLEPDQRDLARVKALLQELLTSFPDHERTLESAAALRVVADATRLQAELAAQRGSLAEESAELEQEQQRLAEEKDAAAERLAKAETEARALRRQVGQLKAQLATVEEELEKNKEALERVKQTLVGG